MRIPVKNTPEVQAQALPGVRTAPVKSALEGAMPVAGAAVQGVMQIKQQADTARVEDALNKSQERIIELKDWSNTLKGGNVMGVGADASGKDMSATDVAMDAWKQHVDEARASLANDTQRQMYDRNAARLGLDLQGHVQAHETKELYNWQVDTYDQTKNVTVQAAAQAAKAGDMAGVAQQSQRAIHAAEQQAILQGRTSPEEMTMAKLAATSPVHSAVVESMLNARDTQGALAYYQANKDQFTAEQASKVDHVIRTQMRVQMAETKSQGIWDSMAPKPDDLMTAVPLEKMTSKLREDSDLKKDPEALKAAIANLRERASEHDYSVKGAATQNTGTLWKAALSGQNYKALPQFSALDGNEQGALIAKIDAFRRRNENSPASIISHMAQAYAWTSNPQKLASATPEAIFADASKLGPAGLQTVLEAKQRLSSPNKVFSATVTHDQIDAIMRSNGLLGGSKGDGKPSEAEKAQAVILKNTVELQVSHDEQAKGRELTLGEKQDIIRRNILKVKVQEPGWLWGTNINEKPLFQIQDPTKIQIDPAAKAKIIQGYRSQGIEPTEKDITNTYLNGLNQPSAPVDLGTKQNVTPHLRRK